MSDESTDSPAEGENSVRHRLRSWWTGNSGWVFVLLSQMFGSFMNVTARIMESDEHNRMHAMEIIFVRMLATYILSMIYMYVTKVPDFPWGRKGIRALLCLRGFTGFLGLYTFYWSIQFLPLSESSILTFLTPMFIPIACAVLFREAIPVRVISAGLVSFAGVIIIAQPSWLFHHPEKLPSVDAGKRGLAITMILLGAVSATASYTIVRWVGFRAHALISVTYFALVSTVGSGLFLSIATYTTSSQAHPIGFKLPSGTRQWLFLLVLGISGFALQFLLTAGLQRDKSAVATSMMYTLVIFSLMFDKVVWGVVPGFWSWIGGVLVIVSTLYVAIFGKASNSKKQDTHAAKTEVATEESPLLGSSQVVVEDETQESIADEEEGTYKHRNRKNQPR